MVVCAGNTALCRNPPQQGAAIPALLAEDVHCFPALEPQGVTHLCKEEQVFGFISPGLTLGRYLRLLESFVLHGGVIKCIKVQEGQSRITV